MNSAIRALRCAQQIQKALAQEQGFLSQNSRGGGDKLRLPAHLPANLHEFFRTLKQLAGLPVCYFDQGLVVALLAEIKCLGNILMKLRLDLPGLDKELAERRNNNDFSKKEPMPRSSG